MSNHPPTIRKTCSSRAAKCSAAPAMGMGAMALAGLMSELGLTGVAGAAPAKGAPRGRVSPTPSRLSSPLPGQG
jgi:hypothetical protein